MPIPRICNMELFSVFMLNLIRCRWSDPHQELFWVACQLILIRGILLCKSWCQNWELLLWPSLMTISIELNNPCPAGVEDVELVIVRKQQRITIVHEVCLNFLCHCWFVTHGGGVQSIMGVTGAQRASADANTTIDIKPRLEERSKSNNEGRSRRALLISVHWPWLLRQHNKWTSVSSQTACFIQLTWPVGILDQRVDDGDGLVAEAGTRLRAEGGQAHHGAHREAATPWKNKNWRNTYYIFEKKPLTLFWNWRANLDWQKCIFSCRAIYVIKFFQRAFIHGRFQQLFC